MKKIDVFRFSEKWSAPVEVFIGDTVYLGYTDGVYDIKWHEIDLERYRNSNLAVGGIEELLDKIIDSIPVLSLQKLQAVLTSVRFIEKKICEEGYCGED